MGIPTTSTSGSARAILIAGFGGAALGNLVVWITDTIDGVHVTPQEAALIAGACAAFALLVDWLIRRR